MSEFVNDARNFVTVSNKSYKNSPELCKQLQHAAQSWERLLGTSGGKINPVKMRLLYSSIVFQFKWDLTNRLHFYILNSNYLVRCLINNKRS